ncbi:MAG: sulfite exporter TauE/SafE family protein [Flavobacteriales bacterium]|nr:sulfite exporter TauE/SafE family protein [Flavobacteriales bacterium]
MIWAALITGLIGSVHCTGMCGPLICAMPFNKQNKTSEWSGLLLYNTGRIISYAVLGLLFGTGGFILSALTGKWFTMIAGILLLIYGLYILITGKADAWGMPEFMRKWSGALFRKKSTWALPFLGMLNGFIPCGAVYAALAGATASGSPEKGALYMLIFGIATWPAMFSTYFFSGYFLKLFRNYYKPATALFLCLLGGLLIFRAVNTQLPTPDNTNTVVCE